MRKLLFPFILSLCGVTSIVGSGFSGWFFEDELMNANLSKTQNVFVNVEDKASFGTFQITAPDYLILEEGESMYDLKDGISFYRTWPNENVANYFELERNDELIITFNESTNVDFNYVLKLKIEIFGYKIGERSILVFDDYYLGLKDEQNYINFEQFNGRYDSSTKTLSLNMNDYIQYASLDIKPITLEQFTALKNALEASEGQNYVVITASAERVN